MTTEQTQQIIEGTIIYHPEYGFGIMNELPTFNGMSVTGIKNQCKPADIAMRDYAKKIALEFYEYEESIPPGDMEYVFDDFYAEKTKF